MAARSIKAGKGGRMSVPTPPDRAPYVLGSRPDAVRNPAMPRIKPALSVRQYGKQKDEAPANPFGNTGLTNLS